MNVLAFILIAVCQSAGSQQTAEAPPGEAPPALSEIKRQFQDEADVRRIYDAEIGKPAYKRMRTKLKRFELGEINTRFQAPNWWSRFWTWVGNLFKAKGPGGGAAAPPAANNGFSIGGLSGVRVIVWILLGFVIIVILAYIIKAASVRIGDKSDRKRVVSDLDTDAIQPSTPPGEIPSDEYMHRAMELAKTGDHRRALRQLVLGGMSWIERAGLIRFRKGLTNRDYVRAIYRRKEQRKRFSKIILNFERVYFGRRNANEEQFQKCLDEYRTAFGQMMDAETAVREQEALLAKEEAASVQIAADPSVPSAMPADTPEPPGLFENKEPDA